MAIFNSYFDTTRGYLSFSPGISPKTGKGIHRIRAGLKLPGLPGQRVTHVTYDLRDHLATKTTNVDSNQRGNTEKCSGVLNIYHMIYIYIYIYIYISHQLIYHMMIIVDICCIRARRGSHWFFYAIQGVPRSRSPETRRTRRDDLMIPKPGGFNIAWWDSMGFYGGFMVV